MLGQMMSQQDTMVQQLATAESAATERAKQNLVCGTAVASNVVLHGTQRLLKSVIRCELRCLTKPAACV